MFQVRRPYLFIVAGETGAGKTNTIASFLLPDRTAYRVAIDMETRIVEYQNEKDDPKNLQYAFDIYPDAYNQITQVQWMALIGAFEKGNWTDLGLRQKPDVLIIDNWALFNATMGTWFQDAARAKTLLAQVGLTDQYKLYLQYNFRPDDPSWNNMVGSYQAAVARLLKQKQVHFVISTPMKNVWENYGVKGYGSDGKPLQRIIGRTVVARQQIVQMADVIWVLSRQKVSLLAAPEVSQDYHNPKSSIVGVPPTFPWQGWNAIWGYTERRIVPTAEQMAGVLKPVETYGAEVTDDGSEALVAGKTRLLTELGIDEEAFDAYREKLNLGEYTLDEHSVFQEAISGYMALEAGRERLLSETGLTREEVRPKLWALGITYTLAEHDKIRAMLMEG